MNLIDRSVEIVGALIGEPSCADAITAIDKDGDLTPAQKRHWSTSLRQLGRYLDRPLSLIPYADRGDRPGGAKASSRKIGSQR
jgi:hypothetical protein